MDINEILQLDFEKALGQLCKDPRELDKNITENRDAYNGKHAILDDPDRKPKSVGDTPAAKRTVTPTNETINFQKLIVNSAVTFLFGVPITIVLINEQDKAFALINTEWKLNKLDYFNRELARDLFVECKVAELWYIPTKEVGKDARIRVTLLSERTGYKIYPHFDTMGDMDAFTVKYEIEDKEGKPVENVDIYTAEKRIHAEKTTSGWDPIVNANILGKIPIVYYQQDVAEWDDVKTQINRAEYLLSNFADTNQYFGAPVLMIKGKVTNLPKKQEMGKVVVVESETNANTGEVSYPGGAEFVTWEHAPESLEMEYKMLKDIIYGNTQTPDLSFSNVKGLTAISGVTIRLMFSDAIFKAKDKQETFGPAMERRFSIIKSLLQLKYKKMEKQIEETDIDIIFNDALPEDVESLIKSLSLARGGEPIMSEKTAAQLNPYVTDAEEEVKALQTEKGQSESLAGSFE
ncbi:MAG TPA: phage portal protein [bacterium]|nr:phage portal protein [bacterium]